MLLATTGHGNPTQPAPDKTLSNDTPTDEPATAGSHQTRLFIALLIFEFGFSVLENGQLCCKSLMRQDYCLRL